jgi:hypothetical protein
MKVRRHNRSRRTDLGRSASVKVATDTVESTIKLAPYQWAKTSDASPISSTPRHAVASERQELSTIDDLRGTYDAALLAACPALFDAYTPARVEGAP